MIMVYYNFLGLLQDNKNIKNDISSMFGAFPGWRGQNTIGITMDNISQYQQKQFIGRRKLNSNKNYWHNLEKAIINSK